MAHFVISIQNPVDEYLEPMELALALAAFEHSISLVFIRQGLSWLTPNQQPRVEGAKSPSKLLKSLPLFGIENCYALTSQIDLPQVSCISNATYQQLLQSADNHFSF